MHDVVFQEEGDMKKMRPEGPEPISSYLMGEDLVLNFKI